MNFPPKTFQHLKIIVCFVYISMRVERCFVDKMENVPTICKNLGRVSCGQKTIEVVKIENKTKKAQLLLVRNNSCWSEVNGENLRVHPVQVMVHPKQTTRFTLSYLANVEDLTENFSYDILDVDDCVARLHIHAESVGPYLSPLTHNVKFYRLKDTVQSSKNIEIVNKNECETKFYFDIDEDNNEIEISQRSGTISASHKLGLKLSFNLTKPKIYFKKIFCLVQYHKPLVFNILGIHQPKLKVEPKNITLLYPPKLTLSSGYEAYMMRGRLEKLPEGEKIQFFQKQFDEERMIYEANKSCPEENPLDQQSEKKHWTEIKSSEIFLTNTYINVKSSPQVCNATALVNISEDQFYRYSWNNDPCGHFEIEPNQGLLEPKSKANFNVYFTISVLDSLYHVELDVEILPCIEPKASVAYLPLTMTLRIIGNSFSSDSCHWLAQCNITPQTLRLSSCVPDEIVYGTFMIERQGHLPFTYEVLPTEEPNFTVQPTIGYLSKSFQLLIVEFRSESKEAGVYEEDLKIKFNDSEMNIKTFKIICHVEKPTLCFGRCNSFTFATVFPGAKLSQRIPIENPTNLHLSYKFEVPDDITWVEVVNPTGLIGPKSFGEVEVIFKPETPCEYLDYIPCYVSSASKPEYVEMIHLQLIGSCQFGYLVALPSYHNFGQISFKETKTFKAVLYNFSMVTIYFRLTPHGGLGGAERDVKITPNRGCMVPKGSLEVEIAVTPHETDFFEYEIKCQNFEGSCNQAQPCEEPRSIISIQFEGVLPNFQITDICFGNGGPLFSPDWAWKMFCVDRINAALKIVNLHDEINVSLPKGMKDFGPLSVYILMEGSAFGDIYCESKVNVICACYLNSKEPDIASVGSAQCVHKKAVVLKQSEQKAGPPKQLLLQLKLNYSHQSDIKIELSLSFPHDRILKIIAPVTCLLERDLGILSFYTTPSFHLKPIFVGDFHPPVQLFWVYNNTETCAAYCLDVMALQKSTNVKGVFDCVNPTGVVPPYSATPLGFLFRPNEIISYSVSAFLHSLEDCTKVINLIGEGIVKMSPTTHFSMKKTIPRKTKLELDDFPLECYENTIDIPFLNVFSQVKRHFYIKNRSKTVEWAFRWHCFNVKNLFNATVEPEEGVVEPLQDVFMTLILRSYSCQAFLNFSLPCDITNFTELKAYENSVKLREKMMKRAKDTFTITEKGVSFEDSDIPIMKKPEPSHIFLTVNTNIVTNLNIDQNLIQKQQSVMKAQTEIQNKICFDLQIKPKLLPSVQEIFEKMIWHILCSNSVENNLKNLQKFQDYNYFNLLSESKTKMKESNKRMMTLPDKSFIQEVLASEMTEVLCKNFLSDFKNK